MTKAGGSTVGLAAEMETLLSLTNDALTLLGYPNTSTNLANRLPLRQQNLRLAQFIDNLLNRKPRRLKVDQARRLKNLEQENARLKRVVSDLTLDKLILKEPPKGNW